MTNLELREFKAALKAFREEHKTAEQARKILQEEGVIDDRGKLKKPYLRSAAKRPEPVA